MRGARVQFHAIVDGLPEGYGLHDLQTMEPAQLLDVGTVCMYAALLLEEAKSDLPGLVTPLVGPSSCLGGGPTQLAEGRLFLDFARGHFG